MFGLGFLSAFVLARRVSVRTTSYQTPELGHLYVSSNAEQYTVSDVPARAIGVEGRYGSLRPGAAADAVLLDDALTVAGVWVDGIRV